MHVSFVDIEFSGCGNGALLVYEGKEDVFIGIHFVDDVLRMFYKIKILVDINTNILNRI